MSAAPGGIHGEAWVIEAMAQAVGQEKARDAVRRAAIKLGLGAGEFAPRYSAAVLTEVMAEPGLVGLVARRLLSRLSSPLGSERLEGRPSAPSPTAREAPEQRPASAPPVRVNAASAESTTRDPSLVTLDELVALLERSLGREKSRSLLEGAFTAVGVRGVACSHEKALAALEHLAKEPGLVGITARFAKPRLLLRAG